MIKLNTCLNNKHRFVLLSKLQFRQENDNTMAKKKKKTRTTIKRRTELYKTQHRKLQTGH